MNKKQKRQRVYQIMFFISAAFSITIMFGVGGVESIPTWLLAAYSFYKGWGE